MIANINRAFRCAFGNLRRGIKSEFRLAVVTIPSANRERIAVDQCPRFNPFLRLKEIHSPGDIKSRRVQNASKKRSTCEVVPFFIGCFRTRFERALQQDHCLHDVPDLGKIGVKGARAGNDNLALPIVDVRERVMNRKEIETAIRRPLRGVCSKRGARIEPLVQTGNDFFQKRGNLHFLFIGSGLQ